MSTKIKLYLGHKVVDCLKGKLNVSPADLKSFIQVGHETEKHIQMHLPATALERHFNVANASELLKIEPDDIIGKVHCIQLPKTKTICFEINKNIFIKDVIENCALPYINFNFGNIVVEFSSPNVAKPFHLGHLRSTIIGNFVANLYEYFHNNVTKLNYLGDWGTQFGFIKVGLEELRYKKADLKANPIKLLYESYVHANKLGENDPEILKKARGEFAKLENGSLEMLEDWRVVMDFTREELEGTYRRLGVAFNEYHRESMYNIKDIQDVVGKLKEKNILQRLEDGKSVALVNDRKVTVLKSDGTSLYLTRDIAAAIDRFERYKFDRMFYLADNGQHDHFLALKTILQQMNLQWAENIQHVKFGRVRGMSSRKGNAVFLKDILDECRELMVQKQIESPTTRVPITDSEISDTLGVSCVVINDLKQRRLKDYEFSWGRVLQSQGDTGIKLQYTHCRLCSLAENCGVIEAEECVPEALQEKEATALIREIARFHEVLYVAQEHLEACVLVTYLFHLCNHINKALKTLKVKGTTEGATASQRLLLFNSARAVLKEGMTILGLKPLTKM